LWPVLEKMQGMRVDKTDKTMKIEDAVSRASLNLDENQMDALRREPGKPLPHFIAWMREKGWNATDDYLKDIWFSIMQSRIFSETNEW
jgi:hypothetical protein